MQVVDANGNIFGNGLEVTGPDGKPKTTGGGGGSPTGPAGGDLFGTYPNPNVQWANGLPTYDLSYYPLSSNPAGYLTAITSSDVITALGFTPYNSTNPSGFITSSALTPYLTSAVAASTYYPLSNPSGFITTAALSGYLTAAVAASTYYPLTNPNAYISGITGSDVTTALGYTPYDATNPSGFITTSALTPYLTTATAAATYQPTLVSGTNIKTINGNSILGSGDLTVSGSNIYTADGTLTAARTLTQGGFDLTIAGTTSSRFFSNGNVGIGTTTNAGFKLDVNGTARVSGQITGQAQFTNSTPTSTNSILLNGISTTDTGTRTLISIGTLSSTGILYGAIGIQGSLQNNSVGTLITTTTAEAIGHMANATSGTNTVNGFTARTNGQGTGGSIGFTWRVSNSTFFWHSIYNDGTYYNLRLFNGVGAIYYVRDRTTTNITFGANTYYASAQLAIDSTTKGFLPPRMTNAQMLAIAAPAAGLVVYDTTNNKHCGYNGTAWQNFY